MAIVEDALDPALQARSDLAKNIVNSAPLRDQAFLSETRPMLWLSDMKIRV